MVSWGTLRENFNVLTDYIFEDAKLNMRACKTPPLQGTALYQPPYTPTGGGLLFFVVLSLMVYKTKVSTVWMKN